MAHAAEFVQRSIKKKINICNTLFKNKYYLPTYIIALTLFGTNVIDKWVIVYENFYNKNYI